MFVPVRRSDFHLRCLPGKGTGSLLRTRHPCPFGTPRSQSGTGHHVRKGDCRRRRQHVPSRTNDATRRAGRSDPTKSDRRRDSLCGLERGSNMACPTIGTTNDMPIIEPATFHAAGLIPFQINPHYLDAHPQGHAGETREQRIEEYITVNTNVYVAGRAKDAAAARRRQAVADRSPPDAYIPLGRTAP